MTLLAVPLLVHDPAKTLADAARAAEFGADLVEYRLDPYEGDPAGLARLVDRSPLPCLVTCRAGWEGGTTDRPEADRLERLRAACSGSRRPAYLDVELAAYQRDPAFRDGVRALVDGDGPGLILSSHDFKTRPPTLYQALEAMIDDPYCRVIKLAWFARSLRDNLEAFEILRQDYKPAIALCMGEFGLPSRVLAKKFGALLTFAALDRASGTAPGQPTLAEMKSLYRWDAQRESTRVYGVIGYPVGHSMSPPVHNAGFTAADYDGIYLPMPIPPEYEHFKATVGAWLDAEWFGFRGASVTIPHKENLLRFVRDRGGEIEPLSVQIGAANTLTVEEGGQLRALNSDYAAVLDSVCDALSIPRDALAGKRVAVLGAGGAARAVVAGFAGHGAAVVVYNRTIERARELADAFNGRTGNVAAAALDRAGDSCCDVIVNCTPIGMHPHVDATPMPAELVKHWGPGTVVFDTIYNPIETRLLREARAAGCVTIPGFEMFVRQAATQFEAWTGQPAPLDRFRDTLRTRLSAS